MDKNIIEIEHLTKQFQDIKAVDDLSFCVKEGELFAFLGVNGAGKSTTIHILCGELKKDAGSVCVDGINIDENLNDIKTKIGVVFQSSLLDQVLSVYDNLESRAALYGITKEKAKKRIEELAKMFDFQNLLKRPLQQLSGGQKRRIDIARALIHQPKILILDEPTTGLDPQTRKRIWNVLSTLRQKQKMTIFLTTHYMEEAADADYVLIIDNGKIKAKGTPLTLKNTYTGDYITIYNSLEENIKKLGYKYKKIKDAYRVYVPNTQKATELIIQYPEIFVDYEITKGQMDDVFLSVTGKELNGGETL